MGKRSTTTTKGGKFMNPTDQARKEQRRKELKKNKKQRQVVRHAVLKGKNPREIIEELEKIDDMEYNPVTPCPLNGKVMSEKRRKLSEMWERVIKLYEKDNPDQYSDLKKLFTNYSARKIEVVRYYESVMSAQEVEVDTIPLPNMNTGGVDDWGDEMGGIPLPPPSVNIPTGPPRSVLKKPPSVLEPVGLKPMLCPGVPSQPPPPLSDYHVEEVESKKKRTIRFGDEGGADDEDVDSDEESETTVAPTEPTGLQKKMLAMAGQDLDQFMKEMEEVHKTREAEKAADLQQRLARLEGGDNDLVPPGVEDGLPALPPGAPPLMYRQQPTAPPPLRPGVPPPGVGLPPGPPPGRPLVRPSAPIRPGVAPPGVRLPPGPPPGVPPRGARPNVPRPLGVVSAKPQLNKMEVKTDKVIEGAPVMRNLKSDVTRFVPTNLRVKREDGRKEVAVKRKSDQPPQQSYLNVGGRNNFAAPRQPLLKSSPAPPQPNKDDAYAAFMKEMQDLL